MNNKIAIVIVCYNRLPGLIRLVESLKRANYNGRLDVTLIFSIDNSGSTAIEEYAKQVDWEYGKKVIRTFNERQGLKKHILSCGDYTEEYDVVIILEDDIVVSESFFNYADQASAFYWDDDNIAGISLYSFQKNWLKWFYRFEPMKTQYDSYFLRVAQSWGQVWTTPKWRKFKEWLVNNKEYIKSDYVPQYINEWPETSWLKYHDRYCIETNRYFIYPYVSLTTNFSDAGTHANRTTNDHQVELQFSKDTYVFPELNEKSVIYDEYMNRMYLSRYIGIPEEELTVDFYGTKGKNLYKKYLLTTQKLDYKVIRSYSLSLRPIEASVIYGIDGAGIMLYDTTVSQRNNIKMDTNYEMQVFSLRTHEWKVLLPLVFRMSIIEIINSLARKIKKCLKR